MSRQYELREATDREVAQWPGAGVRYEMGGRHRRAVLRFGDRTRFVVFSITPSDTGHGMLNHISMVRRTLRELGAVRTGAGSCRRRRTEPVCAARASPA